MCRLIHVGELVAEEFANGGRVSIYIAPATEHLSQDEMNLFLDSNYPALDQTRGFYDIRDHLEECPHCVTATLDLYEAHHGRLPARYMQPAA
jgi:hypothetical protein